MIVEELDNHKFDFHKDIPGYHVSTADLKPFKEEDQFNGEDAYVLLKLDKDSEYTPSKVPGVLKNSTITSSRTLRPCLRLTEGYPAAEIHYIGNFVGTFGGKFTEANLKVTADIAATFVLGVEATVNWNLKLRTFELLNLPVPGAGVKIKKLFTLGAFFVLKGDVELDISLAGSLAFGYTETRPVTQSQERGGSNPETIGPTPAQTPPEKEDDRGALTIKVRVDTTEEQNEPTMAESSGDESMPSSALPGDSAASEAGNSTTPAPDESMSSPALSGNSETGASAAAPDTSTITTPDESMLSPADSEAGSSETTPDASVNSTAIAPDESMPSPALSGDSETDESMSSPALSGDSETDNSTMAADPSVNSTTNNSTVGEGPNGNVSIAFVPTSLIWPARGLRLDVINGELIVVKTPDLAENREWLSDAGVTLGTSDYLLLSTGKSTATEGLGMVLLSDNVAEDSELLVIGTPDDSKFIQAFNLELDHIYYFLCCTYLDENVRVFLTTDPETGLQQLLQDTSLTGEGVDKCGFAAFTQMFARD
ncbi:hypothetical protein C8R43DRAFT_1136417 [Mycena crocata]|nr:hypothetical protein C8R43DRAFT_1136417 [Mycena crocata]